MNTLFLIISTILPLYSPIVYIRSILKGEAKPHRITRFVYLATGILTTVSLLTQHNLAALLISGVSALQSLVLFFFSFKFGVGGWSTTDLLCLVLSLVGIILWQTTSNSFCGLYFGIAADFAGSMPTILKTIAHPETEIPAYYAIDSLAGIFNTAAMRVRTFQTAAYPVYLVFINGLIALLAARKKSVTT